MKPVIKENRRSRIIDCAENVFFDKGYAKTNVSDICKSANCSRTTLYSYFETKENIYLAVVAKSFQKFIKHYMAFDMKKGNGMEKILRLAKGYIDFSKQSPKSYALILDFYSILKNIKNQKLRSDTDISLSQCSYFDEAKKNAEIPATFLIQIIEEGQKDRSINNKIEASTLFLNIWAYLIGSSYLFNFSSTQDSVDILGLKMETPEENTFNLIKKILS